MSLPRLGVAKWLMTSRKVSEFIKKSMMKKQEKPNSPPSTRSSNQSDKPSLSHLPTLLQLALPHPLPMVLHLGLPPYPLSSNQ
ncbi:hypothetical protein E2C01_070553 [Portunus trituberculatus]|uniref:Uncharacterized protein n=1 Tax=Portunus trituberculatus TaxID=210409 RepID=A0A5B7I5K2_PORTR|nr:hypothetical protein [Portunus trituberculatus]